MLLLEADDDCTCFSCSFIVVLVDGDGDDDNANTMSQETGSRPAHAVSPFKSAVCFAMKAAMHSPRQYERCNSLA
jgi:hypothetical protein